MMSDNTDKEIRTDNLSNRPNMDTVNQYAEEDNQIITIGHIKIEIFPESEGKQKVEIFSNEKTNGFYCFQYVEYCKNEKELKQVINREVHHRELTEMEHRHQKEENEILNRGFILPSEQSEGTYNSKILETKLKKVNIKQLNSNRPNKPNSNKLTYNKLIRHLNKTLNTDKELSHSSINNVNTVKLSFMSNKDL